MNRISGRMVSLYRPYVRPIKTGKQGRETEFGARGALTQVDGFLFLDHWKHEAFNESEYVARHIQAYVERFGKLTPYFVGDTKYGTRKNRAGLETLSVRPSFKPLGRKTKPRRKDPWFRRKQKERNRIEGGIGHGKEHFGWARVRYKGEETSEVWVRASLLAMNLKTALKRAEKNEDGKRDGTSMPELSCGRTVGDGETNIIQKTLISVAIGFRNQGENKDSRLAAPWGLDGLNDTRVDRRQIPH